MGHRDGEFILGHRNKQRQRERERDDDDKIDSTIRRIRARANNRCGRTRVYCDYTEPNCRPTHTSLHHSMLSLLSLSVSLPLNNYNNIEIILKQANKS